MAIETLNDFLDLDETLVARELYEVKIVEGTGPLSGECLSLNIGKIKHLLPDIRQADNDTLLEVLFRCIQIGEQLDPLMTEFEHRNDDY